MVSEPGISLNERIDEELVHRQDATKDSEPIRGSEFKVEKTLISDFQPKRGRPRKPIFVQEQGNTSAKRKRKASPLSDRSPRLISSVPSHNPTFISRHFTKAEITHCHSQPSPPSSFTARWVGKEAVFKSLGMKSKGVTAAMKDIEIVNDESSVLTVHLHGEAKAGATGKFEHCYDFKRLRQSSTVVGSKVQVLMSLEECKS